MLATLAKPAPMPLLAAILPAVCLAVALYCVAYSALAGSPESFGEAFVWSAINIAPWLLAFEAGKRFIRLGSITLILAAAFIVSLLLGTLVAGSAGETTFEALRRVPGLMATAALIGLIRFVDARQAEGGERVSLPLTPDQIDWVGAAGNYIEIRAAGRVLIRRASLGAAERELLDHGFVRIHRSTLVRRDRIARVRPTDVLLRDGTSLKTGKRYRSGLLV